MSDLRKQLQSLKREYKSAKYPGSLADELLAPPRRERGQRGWGPMRIGAFVTVATGIAAALLISLLHTPTITTPPPIPPTAIATTQELESSVVPVAELASVPAFPQDLPMAPSGESFVPSAEVIDLGSMPEMPSISFDFGSLSTTEEPV